MLLFYSITITGMDWLRVLLMHLEAKAACMTSRRANYSQLVLVKPENGLFSADSTKQDCRYRSCWTISVHQKLRKLENAVKKCLAFEP